MNLGMRTAPIVHEHHRARSAAHTVTNKHSSKVMDDRRNPHTHTHHHSNPPRVAPEIRTILPELKDIVYRTSHEQIKTRPTPHYTTHTVSAGKYRSRISGTRAAGSYPSSCFNASKRRWAYLPPSDGRRGKRRACGGRGMPLARSRAG